MYYVGIVMHKVNSCSLKMTLELLGFGKRCSSAIPTEGTSSQTTSHPARRRCDSNDWAK